jgi:hypothetical protein
MTEMSPGPGFKKPADWRVCRIDPIFDLDPAKREYGHWWIEVSRDESYGFWPREPLSGLLNTIFGVPGAVNSPSFTRNPRRDPHHGDASSTKGIEEYDVWVPNDVDEHKLLAEIRKFADGFHANWAWPATPFTGENCHSFQEKLLRRFNLQITRR